MVCTMCEISQATGAPSPTKRCMYCYCAYWYNCIGSANWGMPSYYDKVLYESEIGGMIPQKTFWLFIVEWPFIQRYSYITLQTKNTFLEKV